ncbi:MAG: [Fe-Fe] hydrogenase large subunit C-terminal domain-containing protein, partial [Planctomycetota bacterium]
MPAAIISTAATACQDCYRCVRECPVKAIKVQESVAQVVDERCIKCGHCVAVCPNQAKRVRDDLPLVRAFLAAAAPVYVSLAPSWVAAWPDVRAQRLIHALQACGFAGVGETALGAQEVSAHTADLLAREPDRGWVSSACPAAADWVRRYHGRPDLVTPLLSPLLAHCRMLREHVSPDIRIVFCGPCVAKKVEADRHPELLDAALTFDELRILFAEHGQDPEAPLVDGQTTDAADFVLQRAADGAWYPVEGGMLAGLRGGGRPTDAGMLAVSGMEAVRDAVGDLDQQGGCFLEALACRGGCVAGPCAGGSGGGLARRRRVLAAAPPPSEMIPRRPRLAIADHAMAAPAGWDEPAPAEDAITRQL